MTFNETVKEMVKGVIIDDAVDRMIPVKDAETKAELIWLRYKSNSLTSQPVINTLRDLEYKMIGALLRLKHLNLIELSEEKG